VRYHRGLILGQSTPADILAFHDELLGCEGVEPARVGDDADVS
jgi:hypothetical protein